MTTVLRRASTISVVALLVTLGVFITGFAMGLLIAPKTETVLVGVSKPPRTIPTLPRTVRIEATTGDLAVEPVQVEGVAQSATVVLEAETDIHPGTVVVPTVSIRTGGISARLDPVRVSTVAKSTTMEREAHAQRSETAVQSVVVGVDALRVETRETGMPPYRAPLFHDRDASRDYAGGDTADNAPIPDWVFEQAELPAHHGAVNPCNKCHKGGD